MYLVNCAPKTRREFFFLMIRRPPKSTHDCRWRRSASNGGAGGAGALVGRVVEPDLEAKHSREIVGAASLVGRVEARAERVYAPLCPCHLVGETRRDVERDPFRRSREPGAGGMRGGAPVMIHPLHGEHRRHNLLEDNACCDAERTLRQRQSTFRQLSLG